MLEVTIIDLDGKEYTLVPTKIELARLSTQPNNWTISAVNAKGGMSCPLDSVEFITIGGVPISVRIIEPTASERGLRPKKRRK